MTAPRCPFHVAIEMVLISSPRPKFVFVSEDDLDQADRKNRKAWHCPVPGCHYVSQLLSEEEVLRTPARPRCRVCGAPVPPWSTVRTRRICRTCYNAHSVEIARRRRARLGHDYSRRKAKSFEIRLKGARAA